MTIKDENDKKQNVANQLEAIFASGDEKWQKSSVEKDITNICGISKLFVEPSDALNLNEVDQFTVEEHVTGTVWTTFVRKS